ncbi:NmrA-like family protein [Naviculisporaceae sp. PSN 640]
MVKIAIAGGSGQLAREVIDALLATNKHEITILSRRASGGGLISTMYSEAAPDELIPGTTWVKLDFHNKEDLVKVLKGVHTVLSFILNRFDIGNQAQKGLIDACVEAGVRRFAPNEWSTSDVWASESYRPKLDVREYLASLNSAKKVLEYTLFQPGLFMNYLGAPLKTTNHVSTPKVQFDLELRRAIIVADEDVDPPEKQRLTLTTIQDIANVVAKAVEFEGGWPVVGGIRGDEKTVRDVLEIAERIRGPFTVDAVRIEDLKAGEVKASWTPVFDHPSITDIQVAQSIPRNLILSNTWGAWVVSDEWNQLLPDYKFTSVEEFIKDTWGGQP